MNKIIFASVIAASVLGFANASYAVGGKENQPIKQFGEMSEMEVNGHMMHMQFIQDNAGAQWVVMSLADAEALTGMTLGKHKFTMVGF